MIIQQQLPLLEPPIPPQPQFDKFPMKISSRILITPYRMHLCLTLFQAFFVLPETLLPTDNIFLENMETVRYDKKGKV